MTNKEYLNKALANKEFVKFLRKHRCLIKYKYNVLHNGVGVDHDNKWKYNFIESINYAFEWGSTKEGDHYWYDLNVLWENSINRICKLEKK